MNRNRFWMLGAFVFISTLLVGATMKARQQPVYRLSHYPQTRKLHNYVADVAREMKTSANAVINISEPHDGKFDEVLEYKISSDGTIALDNKGFSPGYGGQSRGGNLDARQLKQVEDWAAQLPPSEPPAKSEDLLVIFLYQAGTTELRLYDHRHPPLAVRKIVGIATDEVEGWISQLPPEQQPSSPSFPHFQSPLRPSNAQRAVN